MRLALPLFLLVAAPLAFAQQESPADLPDAPSHLESASPAATAIAGNSGFSTSLAPSELYRYSLYPAGFEPEQQQQQDPDAAELARRRRAALLQGADKDANGNPIPLERRQPKRILGILPNYRTVAAGAAVHPPGWKYNFHVATNQAFDYSSFIFLGLTSVCAEGIDSHPALGKGVHGFYSYTWRGLLDKTDGTYLSAFVLASALREDTRYYPLGSGHRIVTRAGYVISRQAVARDYTGHQVFNMAGLGGKVLTQYISRSYYPAGSSDLGVLATKFAYSAMRDIAFSAIREFYPDIAAHYIRKHREKAARLAAMDAPAH